MDDVRAVMDAVGSEQAALFGYSEGGPMCILFAATYPERTRALVLYGTYAKRLRTRRRLPVGADRGRSASAIARELEETWGENVDLSTMMPERRRRSRPRGSTADGASVAEPGRRS